MSRGSSLIAGVLLIGILSTFAVALQGAGNQIAANQNEAMLAQVKTSTDASAPKTPVAKSTTAACEPAFESYKIFVNEGKTDITCARRNMFSAGEGQGKAFRCPGKGSSCSNAAELKAYLAYPEYNSPAGCSTLGAESERCAVFGKNFCEIMPKEIFCPGPQKNNGTLKTPVTATKTSKDLQCQPAVPCAGEVGKNAKEKFKSSPDGKAVKDLLKANPTNEGLKNVDKALGGESSEGKSILDAFKKAEDDTKAAADQAKKAAEDSAAASAAYNTQCSDTDTGAACYKLADNAKALDDKAKAASKVATEKQKALDELKAKQAAICPGSPGCQGGVWNPDTKKLETPMPSPGPGGGGPGGGGGDNKDNTFGKGLGDLGKLLGGGKGGGKGGGGSSSPASGSGSGAQGQPPQCFDNYSSQTNSSTRSCQCQQGYSIQAGYCQGGNQCPTGYVFNGNGCQPATASSPVATISRCDPTTQDIGEKVKVTFACQNATSAVGLGFDTAGQLSGVAEATIQNPPAGVDRVSYGLTCTSQTGQTTQARQCDVTINKPRIILVTNPKRFDSGKDTTIGWMTVGMERCTLASTNTSFASWNDEQDDYTNVSGSAKTPVLNSDTVFKLTCTTKGGKMKEAQVTADVI